MKETRYLVKTHGITNLWRGNSATILRIFPLAGVVILIDYFFMILFLDLCMQNIQPFLSLTCISFESDYYFLFLLFL